MTFEQALQASGLIPGEIVPDGRWRRCRTQDKRASKRNGAYVLYPDGRGYFRNWATDHAVSAWSDESTQIRTPSAAEMAERERRKKQEREYRLRAIRGAREQWAQARSPRSLHPYLRAVYDAFGARRVFWGTDLTRLPCSYRQALTLFSEELPWLSAADKEWTMGRGVCAWLGWEVG